jgi:hypothetical protein
MTDVVNEITYRTTYWDSESNQQKERDCTEEEVVEILQRGIKSPEVIQSEIIQAVQLRLDTFAQSRNYDSILSACTYASSVIEKFSTEGQYAVNARDMTWAELYTVLGEVQGGLRPMPTGYAEIEPELPLLEWPL